MILLYNQLVLFFFILFFILSFSFTYLSLKFIIIHFFYNLYNNILILLNFQILKRINKILQNYINNNF
jgi:hypothetical protein